MISRINTVSISSPGSSISVNEDALLATPWAYAVFDGATGLSERKIRNSPSDAHWFTSHLAKAMEQFSNSAGSFSELLEAALGKTIEEFLSLANMRSNEFSRLPAHELPLSAMSAIAVEKGSIMGYGIGDCELLVRKRGSGEVTRVFRQHPTHLRLDRESAQSYANHRNSGLDHKEARAAIRDQLIANRKKANASDGYPVLSLNLSSLKDIQVINLSQHFSLTEGDQILLCSDGVVPLYDQYKAFSLNEMFDTPCETLICKLREIEAGDPGAKLYPRTKPSDDATLIVITV